MLSGILITAVLFMFAIAMCVVTNIVVFGYMWNSAPSWVRLVVYVVCITIVMVALYHAVGYVWGVYDVSKG